VLQLTNMEYRHRADHAPIVHGMTLSIARGELVALVGPNGAGKSTLARLIAGLLEPTGGSIAFAGSAARAMVLQDPAAQLVGETVAGDVAFGLELAGLAPDDIAARTARALEMVGIAHLSGRDPRELSGGEQQRVAIAGAVARAPDLLILDEPTSLLDGEARARVAGVIGDTMRTAGCTGIWVTQEADELAICSRVIALDAGEVVFDGAPADLYRDPTFAGALGIGVPSPVLLARALARAGLDLNLSQPPLDSSALVLALLRETAS